MSNFGPLYANMDSSLDDFLQSLERLINLQPEYIISGHGQAMITEDVGKRLKDYRDIIYIRHEKIVNLLRRGCHTLDEVARELLIYGQLPKPEAVFYIYEKVMILAHLNHLIEQGQLVLENDKYFLSVN